MIELSDISFMELTLYGLSVVSAGILGVRWGSKNKGANNVIPHSLLSSFTTPSDANKPDPKLVKEWISRLHAAVQKNWNHADLPTVRNSSHLLIEHKNSFLGFIDQLIARKLGIFVVKQECFEPVSNNLPVQLKAVEDAFKRYAQAASFEEAVDAYRMMVYGKMLAISDSILEEEALSNIEIVAIKKTEGSSSRSAVALLYTEDDPVPFRLVSIRYSSYGPVQSLYLIQFSTSYGGTTATAIANKAKSNWYRRLLAP